MLSTWTVLAVAFAGTDGWYDVPYRSGETSGKDAAVVIGIGDYFELPDVPHASHDADVVTELFIYTLGIPHDRVERVASPATKERIDAALQRAAGKLEGDGSLWLYFAGHGVASPSTGERLLVGADALPEAASIEARSISVPSIKATLVRRI